MSDAKESLLCISISVMCARTHASRRKVTRSRQEHTSFLTLETRYSTHLLRLSAPPLLGMHMPINQVQVHVDIPAQTKRKMGI